MGAFALTSWRVFAVVAALACCLYLHPAFGGANRLEAFVQPLWHAPSLQNSCEQPKYTVRILVYEPLIIHIEGFFTPAERHHLLELAAPLQAKSKIFGENGTRKESSARTSSTAFLPWSDPTVHCIRERVSEFQGFENPEDIERLQVTSYKEGQEFRYHHDYFPAEVNRTRNRRTTFFGSLDADCDNCGTEFPYIGTDWSAADERWCRIVDCAADTLTVRPVLGSALFWRNLDSDGSGDERTLHAGARLTRGYKVGVNIWTRQDVGPLED